jgi:hypothetical protein
METRGSCQGRTRGTLGDVPEGMNVDLAHKLTEREAQEAREKRRWQELAEIGEVIILAIVADHLPIDMYVVSPQKAGATTRSMSEWLLDHARMLEIVVGLAFGVIFLWKGMAVLVG